MIRELRIAIVVFLLLTVVTGIVYPGLVTLVAAVAFPDQAGGSLIRVDGKLVGSRLIGQPFSSPRYFWGRPSATGPMPNNGAVSSGSNQGPLNPALIERHRESRRRTARGRSGQHWSPVPVDLVTASGSGLDPHISLAAARIPGAARGAGARPGRGQ